MQTRIKQVQKKSGLTQTEFAEKIGISRTALQKYFARANNPSVRTIKLICSEFNINREWLETGKGEMKVKKNENADFLSSIIKNISSMPGGNEFLAMVANAINNDMQTKKDPEE